MPFQIVSLIEQPDMLQPMAQWFHEKWGTPKEAYLESMQECLSGAKAYP